MELQLTAEWGRSTKPSFFTLASCSAKINMALSDKNIPKKSLTDLFRAFGKLGFKATCKNKTA